MICEASKSSSTLILNKRSPVKDGCQNVGTGSLFRTLKKFACDALEAAAGDRKSCGTRSLLSLQEEMLSQGPASCMRPFKYRLIDNWFPVRAMTGERFNFD
jgi:hypothetical protein